MKKRFKEARFAANVNRDEIMDAMNRTGVELETVMQFIIERQGMVK
jgi:predicted hydrolase (HD superfamily)